MSSDIPTGREYMQSRRQYIQNLHDRIERAEVADDDEQLDELREELDTLPLSVEIVRHVEIMLGFGGPTDWLDVELGKDGYVRSVTYHYAWGGETYTTTLSESDDLYRYAESVAEYAGEG